MPSAKKIRCYDLEGNYLTDYNSAMEAAQTLSVGREAISMNLSGKNNYVENYQFRVLTDQTPLKVGCVLDVFNSGRENKAVAKYWGTNLICVYNSYNEAAEKNNINKGNISHCVTKGTPYKGFTFKEIV